MAKQSGLGHNFYLSGYDISGDVGVIDSCSGSQATLDVTGINSSANERIGGERTGQFDFTTFFNPAANQEHARLSTLPSTDVQIEWACGTTLGNPAACIVGKQLNYDWTLGTDGSLALKCSVPSNGFGLEWGYQLTAGKRSDTTATNGASWDSTGGYTFGFQAYLQVFSFTGTSATIKIQSSTDDGGTDPYSDVTNGSFGAQTAIGFSRIATGVLNLERYLRVVTTGTFSQCTFAVVVCPNLVSTVF